MDMLSDTVRAVGASPSPVIPPQDTLNASTPNEDAGSGLPSGSDVALCESCMQLMTYDELSKIQSGSDFRHGNIQNMRDNTSSSHPCPLCLLIRGSLEGMDDGFYEDLEGSAIVRLSKYWGIEDVPEGGHTIKRLQCTASAPGVGAMGSCLCLIANEGDPATSIAGLRPVLTDLTSEHVYSLAKSWLGECEETHAECKDRADPPMPTRIINVEPGEPGTAARLIVPAVGQRSKYLCLSYCWGGAQRVTATRASLERLQDSIPVDQLGLTIRDAIETTRRLGFRYLLVDALCIVQDSEEDKQAEIHKMASIYSNATATIFAATAASSNDGFLRRNRDSVLRDGGLDVGVPFPNGVAGNIRVVPQQRLNPVHPLDSRA